MTKLMEEAIRRIADLPEDQQDAVAAIVLAELESEDRWDRAFAESQDLLEELAAEAVGLDEKGKTSSLFQKG